MNEFSDSGARALEFELLTELGCGYGRCGVSAEVHGPRVSVSSKLSLRARCGKIGESMTFFVARHKIWSHQRRQECVQSKSKNTGAYFRFASDPFGSSSVRRAAIPIFPSISSPVAAYCTVVKILQDVPTTLVGIWSLLSLFLSFHCRKLSSKWPHIQAKGLTSKRFQPHASVRTFPGFFRLPIAVIRLT